MNTIWYNVDMNTWVKWCGKTVQCTYCREDITNGEPAVYARHRLQKSDDSSPWTVNFRWHAKRARDGQCCYITNQLEYLAAHPRIETRGKKKMLISAEVRSQRLKLLQRRARLVQRLKVLTMPDMDFADVDAITTIGQQITELKGLIEPLGGIPNSWNR